MTEISPGQFHEADGVADWRVVGEGACTYFRTGSLASGAQLVQAISELAGLDDHHPDVDVRHGGVMVRLITIAPGYYGLTEHDPRAGPADLGGGTPAGRARRSIGGAEHPDLDRLARRP